MDWFLEEIIVDSQGSSPHLFRAIALGVNELLQIRLSIKLYFIADDAVGITTVMIDSLHSVMDD